VVFTPLLSWQYGDWLLHGSSAFARAATKSDG